MDELSHQAQISGELSKNGLFIIGHARSGTSVLQMALNTSPDIFIFGEANFHCNVDKPNFASWYNAMHESFGNVLSKSTTCPELGRPEATGWEILLQLRVHHRLVGDKIAFRTKELGYDIGKSYRFLRTHFYRSNYICILRDPGNVLASNQRLFRPENIDDYAVSYLESLLHIIDVHQTFDFATVLIFEKISAGTFEVLSERLACSLKGAHSWYSRTVQQKTHSQPETLAQDVLEKCDYYYGKMRDLFDNKEHVCGSRGELYALQQELKNDLATLEAARTKASAATGSGPR